MRSITESEAASKVYPAVCVATKLATVIPTVPKSSASSGECRQAILVFELHDAVRQRYAGTVDKDAVSSPTPKLSPDTVTDAWPVRTTLRA